LRGNQEKLIQRGLKQVTEYGDTFHADELHFILFDRNPDRAWDKKIWHRSDQYGRQQVEVWGC
ncbi:MAG: ATP-binding protein, partial [Candidatus Electrothrix sp. AR3]|nr:ATP-binding protein [Candidatus Electrothrix sp. AR3]